MNKKNRKGFTLVELVIVIAVIAILAGVLIGTFSTVLTNANKSKAMQTARLAFEEFLVDLDYTTESEKATNSYVIKQGDYYFAVNKGQFIAEAKTLADAVTAATPSGVTLTASDLKEYNFSTAGTYFVQMSADNNFYALNTIE